MILKGIVVLRCIMIRDITIPYNETKGDLEMLYSFAKNVLVLGVGYSTGTLVGLAVKGVIKGPLTKAQNIQVVVAGVALGGVIGKKTSEWTEDTIREFEDIVKPLKKRLQKKAKAE